MGTHKIYSGIQGIRDNISGSLYGDCHELLAHQRCAVKHHVMNELVMGRASQRHERGKNPQITSKRRDRWSL